jgi:hypothetical protein
MRGTNEAVMRKGVDSARTELATRLLRGCGMIAAWSFYFASSFDCGPRWPR